MVTRTCVLFCLLCAACEINSLTEFIRIGGVFDSSSDDQEMVFRHVAEVVNKRKILHPYRLSSIAERVSDSNMFKVHQTVCSLLSSGVIGIFGPNWRPGADYVHSICDTKEIPHIDIRWNHHQKRGSFLVNLYPYPPILSRVAVELVDLFEWKSFTILYENDESLIRISELLKEHDSKVSTVTIRQLDERGSRNYRETLVNVKKSGERNFVLDCSIEILGDVLEQALQVGLMSDNYNYIITNLDLHTLDLFAYQHGGVNITGFQIVDPSNPAVRAVATSLQDSRLKLGTQLEPDDHPENFLRTETALMYDAVYLFAEALRHIIAPKKFDNYPVFCNSTDSWKHGSSMINYLRTRSIQGLTGNVKFDYQGFRSEFALNVVELTKREGLKMIGTWNSSEGGINIQRIEPEIAPTGMVLYNKSFVVLLALSEPYNMLKEASHKLSGNERFEGFGIDLIHELSLLLGFNYTFRLQEDGQYGNLVDPATGKWNGMLGEIIEGRADLGITDLTITSEREKYVDFTMPFMNLGISILFKKPMKLPPKLFSFMSPFSKKVWYCVGGAYIGVSIMLYLMGRISPSEWVNRYPCINEPEFLENQFTLRNSFWFTVGSFMQQGSEIAPIAISTRMVAGIWWFFTLIMVSSYTAQLASSLAVGTLHVRLENVGQLANQTVIKYGAKKDGSTANFFRDANSTIYDKIWKFMNEHPDAMPSDNSIGVSKAETEDYAFFMESTTIEYTIQRHCNLTQVGGLLDDKGYGIAMKKNSPYRHILSTAVLKLQETGKLNDIKRKWWNKRRGGGKCMHEPPSGDAKELGLDNVGGVFFVLAVGSIAGLLIGILEMLLHSFKVSIKNKTSFKKELKDEVDFFLKLRKRTKPVHYRKASTQGSSQSYDYNSTFGFVPDITKHQTIR